MGPCILARSAQRKIIVNPKQTNVQTQRRRRRGRLCAVGWSSESRASPCVQTLNTEALTAVVVADAVVAVMSRRINKKTN